MAGIDILCSDKTGTLTQNKLTLGDPVVFAARSTQELILYGALASKAENQDSIDLAVLAGLKDKTLLRGYSQLRFVPFDPVHKKTESTIRDASNEVYRITKGAPQLIIELCHLPSEVSSKAGRAVEELAAKGYRTLGVARSNDDAWEFLGLLPLFDPPREDSADTIADARRHGIEVTRGSFLSTSTGSSRHCSRAVISWA
jgi:H+-transporting ATPase